jgi:hypothetical protein
MDISGFVGAKDFSPLQLSDLNINIDSFRIGVGFFAPL